MSVWLTKEVVALGLVVVMAAVLYFSAYRYLLWYFFGGMVYWLLVELIQWVMVGVFGIGAWHGYVAAFAVTWLPPVLWLGYLNLRQAQPDDITQPVAQVRTAEHAHKPLKGSTIQPIIQPMMQERGYQASLSTTKLSTAKPSIPKPSTDGSYLDTRFATHSASFDYLKEV